jgi:hypothetical protein
MLAFALAANEGNIAAEEAERASSDGERQTAEKAVETARDYCRHLRAEILTHCEQHGC